MNDKVNICSNCKPFIVKSTEIEELFNKIEANIPIKEDDNSDENYKLVIQNILFAIFAKPGPILRSKIDEETVRKKTAGLEINKALKRLTWIIIREHPELIPKQNKKKRKIKS